MMSFATTLFDIYCSFPILVDWLAGANLMTIKDAKLRYLFLSIFGWLVVTVFFSTTSYLAVKSEQTEVNAWAIFRNNFFRFAVWTILFQFIYRFINRIDRRKLSSLLKIFIHIPVAFIFATIHFAGFAWLSRNFSAETFDKFPSFFGYVRAYYFGNLTFGLIVYIIIAFASQLYVRNKKFAEQERKSALLQTQLTEAQLQALKMQLQPHFLFNTLNSISSLIVKNPYQAQTMIAKLGDFLRMTLDFNENPMVTLREELQFLRSYLEIEQVRFAEKLEVEFNIEEDAANAFVPHLLLQPIVENSIKHGISQITDKGKIQINALKSDRALRIEVIDNGRGTAHSAKNESEENENKTGLTNVKSRLKHIYGEDFGFEMRRENNRTLVDLTIPFQTEFSVISEK